MLWMRGIAFPLTGLLLAGCVQPGTLAPASEANFTARDRQQLANPPYRGRGFHLPISARSFNITGRKHQALSWSKPVAPSSTTFFREARRFATAQQWARLDKPGPASPRLAARRNGRDGLRLPMRRGGLARFQAMSKAARAIQWGRAPCIFTLAGRIRCIASTAPTSPNTSEVRFPRAASG